MPVCVGDCSGDGAVTIDELLIGISILLGAAVPAQCPELDRNGDQLVTVDEIVTAVGVTLAGCPDLPRFPVGAYFWPDHAYGQTGSALGDLAAFGLNTVVAYYEYVKPDVPPFSGQPDCHGLVREAEVSGIDFFIGAPRGDQVRPLDEPALAARLQATIDCVGASPRYQGWMFDEPELTGYDAPLLERATRLLRTLHSRHRVWVNFSPFATDEQFQNLGATADIVGFDIYPISDVGPRPLTAVGEYTRRARDLAAPDTEVWMIVQAFGYSDLPNEGGHGRRPTPHELRFMVYDALIHGARGIVFFGSHQLRNTIPLDEPLWDRGVRDIARELGEIGPALLRCGHPCPVPAAPAALVAVQCEGSDLLIAANATAVPVAGTLRLGGDAASVREIFDNREISVADGVLRDDYSAYQVHVYVISP